MSDPPPPPDATNSSGSTLSPSVTWNAGGTATISSVDDDRIELVSSRAFAPGSRPEGRLDSRGSRIWLKVHGSRRQADGSFHVKGRLLNVTREERNLLKEAVFGANGGKSSTP